MTFPPALGSKNLVLMLRSVRTIVIAPAKTGRESTNKKVVTIVVQTKRLSWLIETETLRRLAVVAIKLIEPRIDLTPAKCNLKIAKSTLDPG
jgi:hypothetical protein